MPRYMVLTLILLMTTNNSKLDLILKHFTNELKDWRKDAPKTWYAYIRMYLYMYYKKRMKVDKDNMQNVLSDILCNSKSLLFTSNKMITQVRFSCYERDPCRCLKKSNGTKNPIGQFSFHNIDWDNFNVYPYRLTHFTLWKLNPKLRMNLTFYGIYLSSGVLNCGLECVIIGSPHNCDRISEFRFSGQYSSFNLYPKYPCMFLLYRSKFFRTQHQVDGMFMIIDLNKLISVPVLNRISSPDFAYKVKDKHTVLRYFILIRKLDHIIIKMNWSSTVRYVVHDGPGLLSDILHLTDNYTVTSTFQCLLLLLSLTEVYFMYTSKTCSPSTNITINKTSNTVFYFPNNKCNRVLCVLTANADAGYQVNITTIVVKSTNAYNYNCLYGGLVTGERLASKYRESKTVCESSCNGQGISFYSKNTSLTAVVYWYQEYSKIFSTIMISQTKCKPVFIDLCYLHTLEILKYMPKKQVLHTFMTLDILIHVQKTSHSYLHDITRFSGIDLSLQKDGTLAYKEVETECGILQFLSDPTTFTDTYNILQKMFYIVRTQFSQ